jgi:hypothetical protein
MDETDRTNCKERPPFCLVGLTADRRILPAVHIFMPFRARWAYNWIFNHAIPHLLPDVVRKNVGMVISDQGFNMVHMLQISNHRVFPHAILRLCAWHLVHQFYKMEVKKKVAASGTQKIVDDVFIDDICSWLYSFASEIETLGQEEMHLHQLNLFISQSVDVTEAVRTATNHFVNVSFLNVLHKICFRHYYRLIGGDVKTTSFVKSYNSVIHRSPTGPRPNQSIVSAYGRLLSNGRRKRVEVANMAERDRAAVDTSPYIHVHRNARL